MNNSFTEIEKRKIISLIGTKQELIMMSTSKIYTTNKTSKSWLYSGMEGFLCFILDFELKAKFLFLFDFTTFECLFKIELYLAFEKNYKILTKNFHSFETEKGFIGLKFNNEEEANLLEKSISKYDDNSTGRIFRKKINKLKEKNDKGKDLAKKLKEKFVEDFNKNNNKDNSINLKEYEKYGENLIALEIFKPRYYEIIMKINYDKEKKVFNLKDLPGNVKKMFKRIGIKKSDFKDESLALHIFKFFMKFYDELHSVKIQNMKNIVKNENNKILNAENANTESNLYYTVEKLSDLDINNNNNNASKNVAPIRLNNSNVPSAPKVPVNVPTAPKININIPKKQDNLLPNNSNETNANDSGNKLFDELAKGKLQLKKIDTKMEDKRQIAFKKEDEKVIQNNLLEAIKMRRVELTKNDIENESSSESDWSD